MSRSVVCYPQPGKAKSRHVLEAFAAGCRGAVRISPTAVLEQGDAAFYGVVGIEHLLRLAVEEERTWWYGDNAYFDCAREKYFRFARNGMQAVWDTNPDHARLQALGVRVKPWQRDGRHVVVIEQSEHFMRLVGAEGWLFGVLQTLARHTERKIVIRRWSRDKSSAARTLQADLQGAWAVVAHMSAAANEAVLAGVPAFVTGMCAALPMSSGDLSKIETPRYPDGREEWAAGLAANQWTLDEMRAGVAWRSLNA